MHEKTKDLIGRRISHFRTVRRHSRRTLARIIHVSDGSIRAVELGMASAQTTRRVAGLVAAAYDVSIPIPVDPVHVGSTV